MAAAKGGAWQQSLVETAGALTLNQMALALLPLVAASLISKLARSSANLWARLLDAGVLSPLKEMLPLLLFARVLTIWFASLSIVLQRLRPVRADLDRPTLACSDSLTRATLLLRQVIFGYNAIGNVSFSFAQALEATYESLWIVLAVRIVLSVKDIVLSEYANGTMEGKRENNSIGFMRFVESVKWFLSLVGWAVGVFNILVGAWGFNVVPLLSSLTASSLIIGLAAQPLLANALAGLAVFSSRQVVPGDHIQLLTAAGGVAIDGFVEVIGPTTTIIRDREDSLVYINNKSMSEMIVRNLSRTVVASKQGADPSTDSETEDLRSKTRFGGLISQIDDLSTHTKKSAPPPSPTILRPVYCLSVYRNDRRRKGEHRPSVRRKQTVRIFRYDQVVRSRTHPKRYVYE